MATRPPSAAVQSIEDLLHASRSVRGGQRDRDVRDVPTGIARYPGDRGRREGGDRVDADRDRLQRLDVARDVGREEVEDMLSVQQDEGRRVGHPGTAVDPVLDAREPAQSVRRVEEDRDVRSIPSVVAQVSHEGIGSRGRGQVDPDGYRLGRREEARPVRGIEFEGVDPFPEDDPCTQGSPSPSVDAAIDVGGGQLRQRVVRVPAFEQSGDAGGP